MFCDCRAKRRKKTYLAAFIDFLFVHFGCVISFLSPNSDLCWLMLKSCTSEARIEKDKLSIFEQRDVASHSLVDVKLYRS